jgi:hypothetical protein
MENKVHSGNGIVIGKKTLDTRSGVNGQSFFLHALFSLGSSHKLREQSIFDRIGLCPIGQCDDACPPVCRETRRGDLGRLRRYAPPPDNSAGTTVLYAWRVGRAATRSIDQGSMKEQHLGCSPNPARGMSARTVP